MAEHLAAPTDRLSPRRRQLLELMQRQRQAARAVAPPGIPRRTPGEPPVLSFGQQRLWFIEQLQPGSAAYHIPGAVRIQGALDVGLLQGCLGAVARRHETLRTGFTVRDGEPVPVVADEAWLPLPVVDLSALPEPRREPEAARSVNAQVAAPFDLTRPPLARVCLLRLTAAESVFLLVLQHIIGDIWSVGVFFRNVMALYDAASTGVPSPLPELAVQYIDFAVWQQRTLAGEGLRALLDYWKGEIEGAPLVLELPTDRPRPPFQSFTGGRRYMTAPAGVTARLKALAQQREASLYMILLAALEVLLFRLTGQGSLLVGMPMANRSRVELEGLIGLLLNTLVLRADLDGETSLRELFAQVRERTLGAIQHQDLLFERLVEELQVERDMSRNPIYQVLFNFQNVPRSVSSLAGARGLYLSRYEVMESISREDLELALRETPEGLTGWFGYDEALFEPATVERIARGFGRLLAGIAEDPERSVGELPLLTASEEHALRCEWNDTAEPEPDAVLPELVAAQAARAPGAVALEDGERSLTYREVDEAASRLAAALARSGVRRGDVVGVLAQRSIDLPAVVLGVMRSGAAYLPLGPEQPARRLAQVLRQARAALVVAEEALAEKITEKKDLKDCKDSKDTEEKAGFSVLLLESVESVESVFVRVRPLDPSDLAYVLFTSGSTGVPKGAALPHRGLLNHLLAKVGDLGLGPRDTVAQTASQSFDISLWQMFAALLAGGRVRVLPDEVAHHPAHLLDAVEVAGITVLEAVPSMLRLVAAEARRRGGERPALARLRWLVSTGEALPPDLWAEWLDLYPQVPLLNAYGPTECSDRVTHQPLPRPPGNGASLAPRTPIGRPLRNLHVCVMDAEMRAVPLGVAGELCVSGAGVGRGYLHDPERTAAAFVPDPFAEGSRLYRTGDRARRRADGWIDFLGRIDQQVKVRGFRIEPGEIEAALAQVAGIRQAVVLADAEAQVLVAHVLAEATAEAAGSDLAELERQARASLQERLPDFMVPGVFVWHPEMPLTPNGKIDRRALAAAGAGGPVSRGEGVAPRNPVEESLSGIWAEVLKRPAIGVYDDFFAAGGHSLLATQVVTRVREAFGVDLPVRTLFQKPTVAGFAETLELALLHGRGLPAIPPMTRIAEAERQGPLEPSIGQERLWFIDQRLPGVPAYNIFGAVRMRGRLDPAVLKLSFAEVVRRHEVLRTTFTALDGRPMQVVGPPGPFPIPRIDLSALPAAQRDRWSSRIKDQEAQRSFDLARGPLLRGLLLRLAQEDFVLVVTAHHVVYDVWSRELLIRELGTLYEAFWHRRPSPLPALPIQFADFARWQRRWLAGAGLSAQLDYWQRQLAGVTSGTELPGDRPRPPVQSFRGRRQLISLPPRLTAALKDLSRRHGATLFMTLLAGFKALLHRTTGEDDVVVGSPIANRNRAETEALIGFFVNTQVLRTRLDGDPSLRQVIGRVRETALGAYAHQDLAFEHLVTELRASRDPARQPLFQILFNFLTNYQPVVLELPELTLSPEANHSGAVQFDVVCSLYEADGALHGSVDFSSDLFDRSTVQRLLRHFAALLAAGAAEPERPVSELSCWPEEERHQLLLEWSARAPLRGGEEARIHELILDQAARTPGAPAVAGPGGQLLTYGELAARVRRLARRLRAQGVGPEVIVGIRLESGPAAVVAILAVLAAGGAYLPLDPAFPEERVAFMAADAGVRLVLDQEAEDETGVPPSPGWGEGMGEGGQGGEGPRPFPENPAYVIYTSGSTGRPKGVVLSHRGLLRSTRARLDGYPEPVSAFLLLPSLAFDSSVAVVFWTLCQGGCLVIPEEGRKTDPGHLARLIAGHRVSHWLSIPRLYALLLAQAGPGDLGSLRAVIVAGEACSGELVLAHRAHLPGAALYNEYGPTEGTVWATVDGPAPASGDAALPIGRPIAGVQIRVLDARLAPVPAGVPAELLIGDGNLARGYLGRPELSAQRFIPDPFAGLSAAPGARLYRTGDLARWLPDGRLDFLGRIDQQVKIRGVRIELGEIEAALLLHPAVREAALLVRDDVHGDRRLVAYVVTGPEAVSGPFEPFEPSRLRAFLRRSLPDSMLPAAFVFLEAMPVTATGKVDRRALAALDVSELARETPFVAPRTPLEERLAAMWSELLGVRRIGALDNFFHLGGHSLLTTQLVSRVRTELALEVPLPSFFDDPTVAGLAQVIEVARWAEEAARQAPAEAAAGFGQLEVGEL